MACLLLITNLTGCFGYSKREVLAKFDGFIELFPTEDFTTLYDKPTNFGFTGSNADKLNFLSYVYTKNEDGSIMKNGISLSFDKQNRQATGEFCYEEKAKSRKEYPIYYDENGFHLVDENVDEKIKESLANFKMMFTYIELDAKDLNKLESTRHYYSYNASLWGITYKLKSDDKNIAKIRELYPEIPIDDENLSLQFQRSQGINYMTLTIYLDAEHKNYFQCYV